MEFSEESIVIDDGHKPGSTLEPTQIYIHKNKALSNFFSVFDNVLSENWVGFSYQYALSKKKPWGKINFPLFTELVISFDVHIFKEFSSQWTN